VIAFILWRFVWVLRFVHLWDWGLRLHLKKYVILDVDRSLGFCRDFLGMALVAFFSMLFIVVCLSLDL
jgi:hypothetical protein